jgi:hypothetical protein
VVGGNIFSNHFFHSGYPARGSVFDALTHVYDQLQRFCFLVMGFLYKRCDNQNIAICKSGFSKEFLIQYPNSAFRLKGMILAYKIIKII